MEKIHSDPNNFNGTNLSKLNCSENQVAELLMKVRDLTFQLNQIQKLKSENCGDASLTITQSVDASWKNCERIPKSSCEREMCSSKAMNHDLTELNLLKHDSQCSSREKGKICKQMNNPQSNTSYQANWGSEVDHHDVRDESKFTSCIIKDEPIVENSSDDEDASIFLGD